MFRIKGPQKKRILLFFSFFAVLTLLILLKLSLLQIFDIDGLKEKAIKHRQSARNVNFRGNILDRNGLRLAGDITIYDIYAHPKYYEKSPREIAKILSKNLNIPESTLYQKLNKVDNTTITIAKNIENEKIEEIKEYKIRGIDIVCKNKRIYPQGKFASHILGYVNQDANIFAGVEKTAKDELEDVPSVKPIEYDGKGNIIYDFRTDPKIVSNPLKGENVVLTLDSRIQHIAEKELETAVKTTGADKGTTIVLNPKNGEILGFAVYPTYDPNDYRKSKLENHKNWAITDIYPPGSTFKILTVASALELNVINENSQILDTGKVKIDNWVIKNHDYEKNPYPGMISIKELFENSSNIATLKIALRMQKQDFYNMLKKFGIGSETGIELPGESAGLLPVAKEWRMSRQANISFGYGISATPLQMAAAVSSVANKGVWVTPHIIKYSEEERQKKVFSHQVLSPETAKKVTKLLRDSEKDNKYLKDGIKGYEVAGKTGTSKKPKANGIGYMEGSVITSFVGYFPADNPNMLIMVVIDNPKKMGEAWGATVALPVFKRTADEIVRMTEM